MLRLTSFMAAEGIPQGCYLAACFAAVSTNSFPGMSQRVGTHRKTDSMCAMVDSVCCGVVLLLSYIL